MAFELKPLPYACDALEPYVDKLTMEIHYSRHHATYVANLNKALENSDALNLSLTEIIKNISKYPVAVRNNGGGHYNHEFFWNSLSSDGETLPDSELILAINNDFGSFEKFKELFTNAALTRFGSGWAWLSVGKDGKLCVCSTPNQDNPMMDIADCPGIPLLGLDVWEHAYYLKYQNKRADYINGFWNIINWKTVNERYLATK